jgi:hypothetical protein
MFASGRFRTDADAVADGKGARAIPGARAPLRIRPAPPAQQGELLEVSQVNAAVSTHVLPVQYLVS